MATVRRARWTMRRARGRWTTVVIAVVVVVVALACVTCEGGATATSSSRNDDGAPLIVVALDGVVRALDADTGRNLWSFDSGGALSGASWDAGSSSSRGEIGGGAPADSVATTTPTSCSTRRSHA